MLWGEVWIGVLKSCGVSGDGPASRFNHSKEGVLPCVGCAEPTYELACSCRSVWQCCSFPQKKKKSFPIRGSHLSVPKATFISSPASPSEFPDPSSLTRHHPFSKTELRQETVGGGGQFNRTQPRGSTGASRVGSPSHAEQDSGYLEQISSLSVGKSLGQDLAPAQLGSALSFCGFAICEGPTGCSSQVLCLFLPAIWLRCVQWGLSPEI